MAISTSNYVTAITIRSRPGTTIVLQMWLVPTSLIVLKSSLPSRYRELKDIRTFVIPKLVFFEISISRTIMVRNTYTYTTWAQYHCTYGQTRHVFHRQDSPSLFSGTAGKPVLRRLKIPYGPIVLSAADNEPLSVRDTQISAADIHRGSLSEEPFVHMTALLFQPKHCRSCKADLNIDSFTFAVSRPSSKILILASRRDMGHVLHRAAVKA